MKVRNDKKNWLPRHSGRFVLSCSVNGAELLVAIKAAPSPKMPLEVDCGRSGRHQIAEVFQRSIAEQYGADDQSGAAADAS